MQFKIKIARHENLKPSHNSLSDVRDLGLEVGQYITGEDLAAEYFIPRESVLKILDAKGIWPIAKIVKRGQASLAHPHGRPQGGRPKLAFDPEQSAIAITAGVEEIYGASDTSIGV